MGSVLSPRMMQYLSFLWASTVFSVPVGLLLFLSINILGVAELLKMDPVPMAQCIGCGMIFSIVKFSITPYKQ